MKMVEWRLNLHFKDKNNQSEFDRLQQNRQRREAKGWTKAQLDEVYEPLLTPPQQTSYGWLIDEFDALHRTRKQTISGWEPFSFQDIKAYAEMLDVDLTPWEVETLLLMDRVWLHRAAELNLERQ